MKRIYWTKAHTIGPLLILFFLFASVALVAKYLPHQRAVQPRAATGTVTLLPSGSGSSTQWSRSGCSSNYDCVNEASGSIQGSDGDSTYVHAPEGTFSDLYNLPSPGIPAGSTINYVKVYSIARCASSAGSCSSGAQLLVRTRGSTYSLGSASAPAYYITDSETVNSNPAGGSWTVDDINNLQVGVRKFPTGSSTIIIRVTKVWAEISYSPPLPDTTKPTTPTNLHTTSITQNSIGLAWNASTDSGGSGLAGYKVYRGGSQITTTTSTSYTNSGLSSSTTYSYYVRAYDNAGNHSNASNTINPTTSAVPDTTKPTIPGNLHTTSITQNSIALAWNASTDSGGSGLAGYKIYRNSSQLTNTTSTSYTNSGLSASTTYSYYVTAYDNAGNNSDPSNTINPKTLSPLPPKPTVTLSATPTSINQGQSTTLTWSSNYADSVTISSDVGAVGTSGSRSVSPTESTTYQAVAIGDGGNSEPAFASVTVNDIPPPPPPPKPTLSFSANPTSITSGESATLTWSSKDADSVTITPDIGTVGPNGSEKITPTKSISYTAIASGEGGSSDPASVSITVDNVPPPPPPPPPPLPPDSGLPTLPPPSADGKVDPTILNFLNLKLSIPYLLGKTQIPSVIGGFTKDLAVSPQISGYEIDVRGAKFPLGKSLVVTVGGNKTLRKKVKFTTKAPKQPVKVGSLTLGDVTGDNKINGDDTTAFLSALSNQAPLGDINADGTANSLDWAILHANYGKKGDK